MITYPRIREQTRWRALLLCSLVLASSLASAATPTVIKVEAKNGSYTYKAGGTVDIIVKFSTPVTVTTTGNAPKLTLNSTTAGVAVDLWSGSTTDELLFRYSVLAGHNVAVLDYKTTSSLTLPAGASIVATTGGETAVLTLPTVGGANSIAAATVKIDTTAPFVSSITTTTVDGRYKAGSVIDIKLNFSETVTVTGTPKLQLNSGASVFADYLSGSNSAILVFRYTVGASDSINDLDANGTTALTLNGGTIIDTALNNASLTLPVVGGDFTLSKTRAIVIDNAGPTVSTFTSVTTAATYGIGKIIDISVKFNEVVTVTSNGNPGDVALALSSGVSAAANYASGSGSDTLRFNYTVVEGHTTGIAKLEVSSLVLLTGNTIRDSAGNDASLIISGAGATGSLSTSKALVINGIKPTIVGITSAMDAGTYGINDAIDILVKFSAKITVTTTSGNNGLAVVSVTSNGNPAVAHYAGGTGTDTLRFVYTVGALQGTSELDVTSLSINGQALKDVIGNPVSLTVPTIGNAASLGFVTTIVVATNGTIKLVTPAAGPLAGGNQVLITGTNFNGITSVKLGATTLTPKTSGTLVAGDYIVNSLSQITFVAPAGTGTHNIEIITAQNTVTKSSAYVYVSGPTITALDKDKGPTTGGQTVVLSGANLSGATLVTFDKDGAIITANTAAAITVTTPAHAAGTVSIYFATAGGASSNGNVYTYYDKPTFAAISPVAPKYGKLNDANQTITITGTNFIGVTEIKFGTSAAVIVAEAPNGTWVTCKPAAVTASAVVPISVTAVGGTSTLTAAFTFLKVPTVTKVTPAFGSTLGGDALVITGTDLLTATSVTLGGVVTAIDANTMTVTNTSISLTTPANGAASSTDAAATTLGGTGTKTGGFTYVIAPTITNVSFTDATVGTVYAGQVTSTGTPAVTSYKATGVPAGMTVNALTGVIGGKPTLAGGYILTITVSNGYSVSKSIGLDVLPATAVVNTAPTMSSEASATPNPATISDTLTFTAAATDLDKNALSYAWDFGDGTTGVGASTTHKYAAVGTYAASVTVSDGQASITSAVTVVVGKISALKLAALKLNFVSGVTNKDSIKVQGTIQDPSLIGFLPKNQLVIVTLGDGNEGAGTGVTTTLTFNDKGSATGTLLNKGKTFTLTGKMAAKAFTTGTLKYTFALNGQTLSTKLVNLGFVNATITKPALKITVPISVTVNGVLYQTQITMNYTATINKLGTGSSK